MYYLDLRNDQIRQAIDVEQVFAAYRMVDGEIAARFSGSMSWKTIAGREYLYRKVGGVSRSLGVRSEETERADVRFHAGRTERRERVKGLAGRLDAMAPVNRALSLGRLPAVAGRILRNLDKAGLIGRTLCVVGTNALFAYERMAGVHIESGLLATADVDLLFDARTTLKIASPDLSRDGLLGLLRKADASFAPLGRGGYRAVNRDGFMVDLIQPIPPNPLSPAARMTLGGPDDLHAVEIEGLAWLVNSPKVTVMVIDDRGYPLNLTVPDPRAFALHKAWLAQRADREPGKRRRDVGQARLVAAIVADRLPNLSFAADDLSALPAALRRMAADLLPATPGNDSHEPRW